ncbi:MAG: Hsp70 family protein [Chitinophagia bacterium]|nr:Hsp70 family protein [Chitinophagia bacterium]
MSTLFAFDIGNYESKVAVGSNGTATFVAAMPSMLLFGSPGEIGVGWNARDMLLLDPDNVLTRVKGLLGGPVVTVGENKISPEQACAHILLELKALAMAAVGEAVDSQEDRYAFVRETVRNAAVTFPTYFSEPQRVALKEACRLAGLNVVAFLADPVAACAAYGLDHTATSRNVFVIDAGHNATTMSVVEVKAGACSVRHATTSPFGGNDFVETCVKEIVGRFRQSHKKDLSRDRKSMGRLRNAVNGQLLPTLYCDTSSTISIDSVYEGIDFNYSITRARFEGWCNDLLAQFNTAIAGTLRDARISVTDVNDVVFVGGPSKVIRLPQLANEAFPGRQSIRSGPPGSLHAVAYGAALYAQRNR